MNDAFLTYNFKKPEYVEEVSKMPFSDFADIPYPVIDKPVVVDKPKEAVSKVAEQPKEEVVEKQEEKVLPTIPSKPTALPKKKTPSKVLTISEFKKQLMPEAERIAQRLKVDPNVILAQSFLESGGDVSKPLFGIKAQKGYKGQKQSYSTKEQYGDKLVGITDDFRTYDSIGESFDDYANLISGKRYKSAIGKTPLEYYTILKNQGYATADHYINSLMNTYNKMSKI